MADTDAILEELRDQGERTIQLIEAEIEAFTRCIELDPEDASAHYNLGIALKDARKDDVQAEAMYRKTIELDPKHVDAHWNLAILLEMRGEVEGAIREARECARLGDPEGDARVETLLAERGLRARAPR